MEIVPGLLVAAGIVGGTLASVAASGWLVLAGPLVLALSIVGADALRSRPPRRPSWAALLLAGSFLLAGAIVALADPGHVGTMIPIFGAAGWVTLPRDACR